MQQVYMQGSEVITESSEELDLQSDDQQFQQDESSEELYQDIEQTIIIQHDVKECDSQQYDPNSEKQNQQSLGQFGDPLNIREQYPEAKISGSIINYQYQPEFPQKQQQQNQLQQNLQNQEQQNQNQEILSFDPQEIEIGNSLIMINQKSIEFKSITVQNQEKIFISKISWFTKNYIVHVLFHIHYYGIESQRRYSDFYKLHKHLEKQYIGTIIPYLPPKNSWEKFKGQFGYENVQILENRRLKLEQFLQQCFDHNKLKEDKKLQEFVQNFQFPDVPVSLENENKNEIKEKNSGYQQWLVEFISQPITSLILFFNKNHNLSNEVQDLLEDLKDKQNKYKTHFDDLFQKKLTLENLIELTKKDYQAQKEQIKNNIYDAPKD